MHVTLIAAQSLDGFITFHDKQGSDFTSEADKRHFRNALKAFDSRVMGAETYRVTRETTRGAAETGAITVITTRKPSDFSKDSIPGKLLFSAETPQNIVEQLAATGCERCALLGGSKTHSRFLAAGCVDELWLTVEPRLFGSGTGLLASATDTKLSLHSHELLSHDTLLLKYLVIKSTATPS